MSKSIFKRLASQHNEVVRHLIRLREKKQHRIDQRAVVVQGIKTINELHAQGIRFKSLIVTESDAEPPVLEALKKIPANNYYSTNINLTRRILGTSSKPSKHEVYAEAVIPNWEQHLEGKDKVLVLDSINDPGNLGTLVRTAMAMEWDSGIITSNTCDLFNDKALRASRGLSLSWPHQILGKPELINHLKSKGFTPVVADMLPKNKTLTWSPEYQNNAQPTVGNGLWFWNFKQQQELPTKIALILSSEHQGVSKSLFKDEIRVSLPMNTIVESLNVANAGSIIMYELNRYLFQKNTLPCSKNRSANDI